MGRPPVDSELVRARLHRPLLVQVDLFAEEQGIERPEAIRRLIEMGLRGHLPD